MLCCKSFGQCADDVCGVSVNLMLQDPYCRSFGCACALWELAGLQWWWACEQACSWAVVAGSYS